MSKKIDTVYHPINKQPVDIYEGFNWPCLFFGPIWFATKGMWFWAIGSLVIDFISFGVSAFIFPFMANGSHIKHLRSKGWLSEEQLKGLQSQQPFMPSLAAINASMPPELPINPAKTVDSLQISQITTIDIPTPSFNGVTQPQPLAIGSFRSKSFILAKLDGDISWKNEYDVIDVETGAVFLLNREAEIGTLGKAARFTRLAASTGFDIMFKTVDDQNCFRVKGKGGTQGGDVYSGSNTQIGTIKYSGMLKMIFEARDIQGNIKFTTKSNGMGILSTESKISKQNSEIGAIKKISKGDAKQILGSSFDHLNSVRKYDYASHVILSNDIQELDKALLLATAYCLAHTSRD